MGKGEVSRSRWRLVFVGGLLFLLVVGGLLAPWLAPFHPNEQTDPGAVRLRPPGTRMEAVRLTHGRWRLADTVTRDGDRLLLTSKDRRREVSIDDVVPAADGRLWQSRTFWLGTDAFGRDVCSRWWFGARVSLLVALLAVGLAMTLGLAVAALAALGPRWLDRLLMRLVDGLLAFPWLFLLIALAAFVPPSIPTLVLLLGGTGWMTLSRLARAEFLSLRRRDFVLAARGLGMTETSIFFRHVLPNVGTPLVVATTLRIGYLILAEASLSFLGLGVQPPDASWGNMIAEGRHLLSSAWWVFTFPALGLVATVVSLHSVADVLRDSLDPRSAG